MHRHFVLNSDFRNIPSVPGVYNWYYPLRIYEEDTYEAFHSRVTFFLEYSLMNQGNGLKFSTKNTWRQWELNLKTSIVQNSSIKKRWNEIKLNRHLQKIILDSSVMFQPLYVGCAKEGLSKRIQSHIEYRSEFATRFREACDLYKSQNVGLNFPFGAFEIEHLQLSYTVFNSKSDVIIFEDIVQSFSNPNLSKT
jgi:hypothetical protein